MGRIILQMMITADGMVSGPHGELDWIDYDDALERDHLARLEQADAVMFGAGVYPEIPRFWKATADDEAAKPTHRDIGRAMNNTHQIVYSHKDIPADQPGDEVRIVADDKAFVEDVQRLKRELKGTMVAYGGVRFARSLVQRDLVDEIHLDICPVILGAGQRLFTDPTHRINLRLLESVIYDSGAVMVHYKVVRAA